MESCEQVKLRQSVYCRDIRYLAARLGLPTDFMCNNQTYNLMMARLNRAGIPTNTIIDNVGQLVREEAETSRIHREKRNTYEQSNMMSWDTYQRWVGHSYYKVSLSTV